MPGPDASTIVMRHEHEFVCSLPNGLHARPASELEAAARGFASSISLTNRRSGTEADAKSVLALVGADIRGGDACLLRIVGADADAALARFVPLLRDELAAREEPVPAASPAFATPVVLPAALRAAGANQLLAGVPAVRGIGSGRIVRIGRLALAPGFAETARGDVATELGRFDEIRRSVGAELEQEFAAAAGVAADVLRSHVALVRDPALATAVRQQLAAGAASLPRAILEGVAVQAQLLERTGNPYLQERALDLQDIGARLVVALCGPGAIRRTPVLAGPAVVVADELTPQQFLALDAQWLRGLVLRQGGLTSHTIILARAAGVPTITGLATDATDGLPVVIDADRGLLVIDQAPALTRYYDLVHGIRARRRARLQAHAVRPGMTRDGHALPILVNASSAADVAAGFAAGAEGVGLFRTEMLFLDRATPPDEDEQFAVYAAALRLADGRPVTLRTFDIGGDKPLAYLGLPAEANPFLGQRGVRLYGKHSPLLRTQLRAMVRAAALGRVRIMAPMIAHPHEMREFRAQVDAVRTELRADGAPEAPVEVGMMLEVPAAVFALPELARWADFFSVGSNDLLQYFFAADRDHPGVRDVADWREPSFLRLLRSAADAAQAAHRPLGICGELAEDELAQAFLLGLGFRSLSMAAPRIPEAKAALSRRSLASCWQLVSRAVGEPDRAGVLRLAAEVLQPAEPPALVSGELIVLDAAAGSKAEAIRLLAEHIVADGRATDAAALEDALWAREETYATDFGHGFAMPHCKSPAVLANTVAILRLQTPLPWGSADSPPVRVVLLLAIRAADQGDEHMKIISRLSRLLMRAEFRRGVLEGTTADAVQRAVTESLASPARGQPVAS